jgi:hypothetical protein
MEQDMLLMVVHRLQRNGQSTLPYSCSYSMPTSVLLRYLIPIH